MLRFLRKVFGVDELDSSMFAVRGRGLRGIAPEKLLGLKGVLRPEGRFSCMLALPAPPISVLLGFDCIWACALALSTLILTPRPDIDPDARSSSIRPTTTVPPTTGCFFHRSDTFLVRVRNPLVLLSDFSPVATVTLLLPKTLESQYPCLYVVSQVESSGDPTATTLPDVLPNTV